MTPLYIVQRNCIYHRQGRCGINSLTSDVRLPWQYTSGELSFATTTRFELTRAQTPDPKNQANEDDTVGNRDAETDIDGLSLDSDKAENAHPAPITLANFRRAELCRNTPPVQGCLGVSDIQAEKRDTHPLLKSSSPR